MIEVLAGQGHEKCRRAGAVELARQRENGAAEKIGARKTDGAAAFRRTGYRRTRNSPGRVALRPAEAASTKITTSERLTVSASSGASWCMRRISTVGAETFSSSASAARQANAIVAAHRISVGDDRGRGACSRVVILERDGHPRYLTETRSLLNTRAYRCITSADSHPLHRNSPTYGPRAASPPLRMTV